MSFTGWRRIQLNLSIAFSRIDRRARGALLIVTSSYSVRLRRSLLRRNVTTSGVLLARRAIARAIFGETRSIPPLHPPCSPSWRLHLATASCLHEKRRGNRSGSRRERGCTPPRRPTTTSTSTSPLEQYKPVPRDENFSKRENSSTGDVMANLTSLTDLSCLLIAFITTDATFPRLVVTRCFLHLIILLYVTFHSVIIFFLLCHASSQFSLIIYLTFFENWN